MLDDQDVKIGGTWARVKFNWDLADTGLQKVTPDTEPVKQAIITCTIIGRRWEGKGPVFKAAGLAIEHPADRYDEVLGSKIAFLNAVENLYATQELAWEMMSPKEYKDLWWSAFQRARHGVEGVDLDEIRFYAVFE